jgi:ABC-type sugar transport system substrate-binding protein
MRMERKHGGKLRHAYPTGMACLVLGLGVLVAGCGSSKEEKSSTSSSSSASAETSSGGASAEVEAAKTIAEEAKATPTEIPLTEPLKEKPPLNKTLVWLQCNFEQCTTTRKAVEEAIKPLKWTLKVINYKAEEPATVVAAFKQALQDKPIGVALNGSNSAVWKSVFPEYEKAKVPIVEGLAGPQETNEALVANLWNEEDLGVDAKILANWMTAESGGKGSAIVLGVPEFPILGGFAESFTKALEEACKACSAETVNATIAQTTSPTVTNGLIVSAAEKNPSAEFIVTSDGALSGGLPAALEGAGISGKKVAGALGTENSQAEIAAGKAAAFTGQNFGYYGWLLVDSILRHVEGMEIAPGDGGMPHQLIVKENVGTPSENMKGPVGYQAKFEELWHLK